MKVDQQENIPFLQNDKFCLQVCTKDVKHEYTAILNHLRVKHNMTLTHYTQTYIKPVTTGPPPGSEGEHIDECMSPSLSLVSPTSSTNNEAGGDDQFYLVYPDHEQVPK